MSVVNSYFISSLVLNTFRNYQHNFFDFKNSSHIIYGENGMGKTNILEGISLLSAGRGLRSASIDEVIRNGNNSTGIEGKITSNLGEYNLNLSVDFSLESNSYKKKYFLDGSQIKNKNLLDYYLNCIWLIPQMDNFFLQDNASKRKFIDRLIFNFDKTHLSRLNEHDKLIRERNKLLSSGLVNNKWLDLIEEKLVEITVPLVVSRLDFLNSLNEFTSNDDKYPLHLSFIGEIEDLLAKHVYSLKVENILKETLRENRRNDLVMSQTSTSAHKSKLVCIFKTTNIGAENSSTGEQKMMLISIISSFVKLLQKVKQISPILLLDEINVHLDKNNTEYVVEKVLQFGSQVFITTTHQEIFKDFKAKFEFLKIN
ncbi:MAG: AAA family ATPase [Alphaproteobacteria bacterium]|jgi:DNA replication and repair protein RecF|nr:AAA family ATPase [Alphaproteobacteria bacterium]